MCIRKLVSTPHNITVKIGLRMRIFGDGQIILILQAELVSEQTAGYYVNNGQARHSRTTRAMTHTPPLAAVDLILVCLFAGLADQKFAFANSRWRTHQRKIHTLVAHTLLIYSISLGKKLTRQSVICSLCEK